MPLLSNSAVSPAQTMPSLIAAKLLPPPFLPLMAEKVPASSTM
jgi:hypothetical protein